MRITSQLICQAADQLQGFVGLNRKTGHYIVRFSEDAFGMDVADDGIIPTSEFVWVPGPEQTMTLKRELIQLLLDQNIDERINITEPLRVYMNRREVPEISAVRSLGAGLQWAVASLLLLLWLLILIFLSHREASFRCLSSAAGPCRSELLRREKPESTVGCQVPRVIVDLHREQARSHRYRVQPQNSGWLSGRHRWQASSCRGWGEPISPLNPTHPRMTLRIPGRTPALTNRPVLGMLLPRQDRRLTGPVRHRDPQPVLTPGRLHTEEPRLFPRQRQHPLGASAVTLVTLGTQRGEDHRVIRRRRRIGDHDRCSAQACDQGPHQRRQGALERRALRLEQRGDKERMTAELDRAQTMFGIMADGVKCVLEQFPFELGIHP